MRYSFQSKVESSENLKFLSASPGNSKRIRLLHCT